MTDPLPRLAVTRKTGSEPFCDGSVPLGFTVLDFWQWSASDLVSNATRGRIAEFIVAAAIGADTQSVRSEWDAFDLLTLSGVKVEVKSAAYVQSWFQEKASKISFIVAPRRYWDAETNVQELVAQRHADVYVFALLAVQDKNAINPLDVSQWEFVVVPTATLNARERSQHSITLKSLQVLCGPVHYSALRKRVESVVEDSKKSMAAGNQ